MKIGRGGICPNNLFFNLFSLEKNIKIYMGAFAQIIYFSTCFHLKNINIYINHPVTPKSLQN
jgi:hypothetical protein